MVFKLTTGGLLLVLDCEQGCLVVIFFIKVSGVVTFHQRTHVANKIYVMVNKGL